MRDPLLTLGPTTSRPASHLTYSVPSPSFPSTQTAALHSRPLMAREATEATPPAHTTTAAAVTMGLAAATTTAFATVAATRVAVACLCQCSWER